MNTNKVEQQGTFKTQFAGKEFELEGTIHNDTIATVAHGDNVLIFHVEYGLFPACGKMGVSKKVANRAIDRMFAEKGNILSERAFDYANDIIEEEK